MSILTIRPDGDSGSQALLIYPASPTTHYDKVDEVSVDYADYVYKQSYNWAYDRYTLSDHTSEQGDISSVTVKAIMKEAGGDALYKLGVRIGTTDYLQAQQNLTTSWALYSYQLNTNPATSVAWTWTDIDNLIAVLSFWTTSGIDSYCAQLWVEVAYTPAPITLSPSGISQPIAIGEPEVQQSAAQTVIPSGIAQQVAIGQPALTYPQDIAPSGIEQAIACGTPQLNLTLQTQGTLQTIAIGTPLITQPQLYESYAEESAYQNVYNNYWLCQTFTPASSHKITSVKLKLCRVGSPGTGTVSIKATDVDGKPTGGDLCSGTIDGNSLPESPEKLGFSLGAGTNLQAGTKYAIVFRFPSGNSSNYGRTRRMYPGAYSGGAAVTSNDSGSTWEVVTDWDFVFEDWGEPLLQTLYPSGVDQPIVIGSPIVYFVGTVYPSGIAQVVAYGIPAVLGGIPSGIIWPDGIAQPVAFGKPAIYKYVWHVVLDGQYTTATPPTNRAFVIGRDDYGNPVWGEAHDTDESSLVGERLDFSQELAIPTTSQAAATAEAILSKMRLNKARGVILIPPNCGQELFDTVELSDKGANQSAVKFRVVGIRFEYNPKQSKYEHKLILGAP